ncbi:MAG: phage holin family protein [Cytophagales bacterium]
MVNLVVRFLLNGVAVFLTAYLLPGVDVTNYETALVTALVLSHRQRHHQANFNCTDNSHYCCHAWSVLIGDQCHHYFNG